jgi:hypothetical protein
VLDQEPSVVAVALGAFLVPAAFLAVVLVAAVRRGRGREPGPVTTTALSLLGGAALGTMLLVVGDDLLVGLPLVGAAAVAAFVQWRAGRRRSAGWLAAGLGLPSGLFLAASAVWPAADTVPFGSGPSWPGGVLGILAVVAGLALATRADPTPPSPTPAAPPGQPGSRAYGSIAAAIREPARLGPVGTSEIAALVALVAAWTIVPFLIPPTVPRIVAFIVPVALGSILAAEAYIRAMPTRSRRAFEAFSWLGEWELRQLRMSPLRVPTTPDAAARWLAGHPDGPEPPGFRVELLILAGRIPEARVLLDRMPTNTPEERWARAEAADSLSWRTGGEGDLAGLEAAAAELLPGDGEDRLRAEVSIATAKVRRRMADGRATPGDAVEPLVEVRERLGSRADGQVGRALRLRLIVIFLAMGLLFGGLLELFGPGGAGAFGLA